MKTISKYLAFAAIAACVGITSCANSSRTTDEEMNTVPPDTIPPVSSSLPGVDNDTVQPGESITPP